MTVVNRPGIPHSLDEETGILTLELEDGVTSYKIAGQIAVTQSGGLDPHTDFVLTSPDGTQDITVRISNAGVSLFSSSGTEINIETALGATLTVGDDNFHYLDPNENLDVAMNSTDGFSVGIGGPTLFKIDPDGDLHGLTGKALTFDL